MSPAAVTSELHSTDSMLASLLDVELMTARLRALLDRADLTVVESTLLDHKPEHRAIVRYRTTGSAGPADIYGKAYADRSHAQNVYRLMSQLPACFEPPLGVPQPLGIDTRIGLVLYAPLTGCSLDTLASTPQWPEALEGAARWLATLHRCAIQLDRRFDVDHEAVAAASWAGLVADAHPEVAASAMRLAAALLAGQSGTPLDQSTPIHKDFHYQHVIVGDRVGVVDLDEARMGDATFDVAHFVANLHLLALRTGTPPTDRARWQETFLGAYASATGWRADPPSFVWCTAYTCAKVAKQLATGRGPRPRPEAGERAAQIAAILEEGLRCLDR